MSDLAKLLAELNGKKLDPVTKERLRLELLRGQGPKKDMGVLKTRDVQHDLNADMLDGYHAAEIAGITNLDDLADVAAPTPASGDFIVYNGVAWVNTNQASIVATPTRDIFAVLADATTPHYDLTLAVAAGGLAVYYNGVRLMDSEFTLDGDYGGFTLTFDVVAGDYLIAEQFNLSAGVTLPVTKTYSSDTMDGIFTYLGTNGGLMNFTNPGLASVRPGHAAYYTATQINDLDATSPAHKATDNSLEQYGGCSHTQNTSSAWWKADFGAGHTLTPTYIGVVGRTGGGEHLRNWKVQGSNDDAAWTDLLTISGAGPDNSTWYSAAIVGSGAYRYIRIFQTGLNSSGNHYLTMGEIELWGTLA